MDMVVGDRSDSSIIMWIWQLVLEVAVALSYRYMVVGARCGSCIIIWIYGSWCQMWQLCYHADIKF